MADILERLVDLHEQATKERSHFYVASCCKDAIIEIERLRRECDRLRLKMPASYAKTTSSYPPHFFPDVSTCPKYSPPSDDTTAGAAVPGVIATSAREVHFLRARISELEQALHECRLQFEYLQEKFGKTGTTENTLARISVALAGSATYEMELSPKEPRGCPTPGACSCVGEA